VRTGIFDSILIITLTGDMGPNKRLLATCMKLSSFITQMTTALGYITGKPYPDKFPGDVFMENNKIHWDVHLGKIMQLTNSDANKTLYFNQANGILITYEAIFHLFKSFDGTSLALEFVDARVNQFKRYRKLNEMQTRPFNFYNDAQAMINDSVPFLQLVGNSPAYHQAAVEACAKCIYADNGAFAAVEMFNKEVSSRPISMFNQNSVVSEFFDPKDASRTSHATGTYGTLFAVLETIRKVAQMNMLLPEAERKTVVFDVNGSIVPVQKKTGVEAPRVKTSFRQTSGPEKLVSSGQPDVYEHRLSINEVLASLNSANYQALVSEITQTLFAELSAAGQRAGNASISHDDLNQLLSNIYLNRVNVSVGAEKDQKMRNAAGLIYLSGTNQRTDLRYSGLQLLFFFLMRFLAYGPANTLAEKILMSTQTPDSQTFSLMVKHYREHAESNRKNVKEIAEAEAYGTVDYQRKSDQIDASIISARRMSPRGRSPVRPQFGMPMTGVQPQMPMRAPSPLAKLAAIPLAPATQAAYDAAINRQPLMNPDVPSTTIFPVNATAVVTATPFGQPELPANVRGGSPVVIPQQIPNRTSPVVPFRSGSPSAAATDLRVVSGSDGL